MTLAEEFEAAAQHCEEAAIEEEGDGRIVSAEYERGHAALFRRAADLANQLDGRKEWEKHLQGQCPYCTAHHPCVLHGGAAAAKVIRLPDGMFEFKCPICGVPSDEVRRLRKELADLARSQERVVQQIVGRKM